MTFDTPPSPAAFLHQHTADGLTQLPLEAYESWWEAIGKAISSSVDRAGTAWIRQYDRLGTSDEPLLTEVLTTLHLRTGQVL